MDILQRALGHDDWTTRQILARCRELSPAQWAGEFDIGHRSVAHTLEHMVHNVETWTDLMLEGPVQARAGASLAELTARWSAAYTAFSALALRIQAQSRLNDTYLDTLDTPPKPKTFGGTILHVITHNHQHRNELLHLLARHGLADLLEGDVLSWESRKD
jgi:uncharacterized damage-inducible protein DinB